MYNHRPRNVVTRTKALPGYKVLWSFRHIDQTEGQLVGEVHINGMRLTGCAPVVTRFLRDACNPDVLWRELVARVLSSLTLSAQRYTR